MDVLSEGSRYGLQDAICPLLVASLCSLCIWQQASYAILTGTHKFESTLANRFWSLDRSIS